MIKLGIIGFSEGNGHPYSWSAIFNGYDPLYMKDCGFPVIPEYLGQRKMPEECISGARVSHVWTQDQALSRKISKAALIENVCGDLSEMIDAVDAFLLARDDWESHIQIGLELLKTGKPVYIDKPIAIDSKNLRLIKEHQTFPGQVFSCSAFRFSNELSHFAQPSRCDVEAVFCKIPKSWEKYAVHLVDPVVGLFCQDLEIQDIRYQRLGEVSQALVLWSSGVTTSFATTGCHGSRLSFEFVGKEFSQDVSVCDTFSAFKNSLQFFVDQIKRDKFEDEFAHHEKVVKILEGGIS